MTTLFICYARVDGPVVDVLVDQLKSFGYVDLFRDVDPDHGLQGGRRWWDQVSAAIEGAEGILYVASRASCRSSQCDRELQEAERTRTPVLPVAIEALGPDDRQATRIGSDVHWLSVDPQGDASWEALREQVVGFLDPDVARRRKMDQLLDAIELESVADPELAILLGLAFISRYGSTPASLGALRLAVSNSRLREVLRTRRTPVVAVDVSPSSETIIAATESGMIYGWDWSGRRKFQFRPSRAGLVSVRHAARSSQFVTLGSDGVVRLWSSPEHELLRTFALEFWKAESADVSPDGAEVAVTASLSQLAVFDATTGSLLLDPADAEAHPRAPAYDTRAPIRYAAALGEQALVDASPFVWDTDGKSKPRQLIGAGRSNADSLSVSGDGRFLVAARRGSAQLWNVDSGQPLRRIRVPGDDIKAVSLSNDGSVLATGTAGGLINLWEVASGMAAAELRGHHAGINDLVWSKDRDVLVSGSADGCVRLWDAGIDEDLPGADLVSIDESGQNLTLLQRASRHWRCTVARARGAEVLESRVPVRGREVAVDGSGRYMAWFSGRDVVIWDVHEQQQVAVLAGVLARRAQYEPGARLAVAAGPQVCVAHDGIVDIRSLSGQSLAGPDLRYDGVAAALAWTTDGERGVVVTNPQNKPSQLWKFSMQHGMKHLGDTNNRHGGRAPRVRAASIADDVDAIAILNSDRRVTIWSEGPSGGRLPIPADRVTAIALGADGRLLATGSEDGDLVVWDAQKATQLYECTPHAGAVSTTTFARSGLLLVSTSTEATRLDYAPTEDRLLRDSKNRTFRALTRDERRRYDL